MILLECIIQVIKTLFQWSNTTINTDSNKLLTFPIDTNILYGVFVSIDTNNTDLNNEWNGPAFTSKATTKNCIIYNDHFDGTIYTFIIGKI